MGHSELMSRDDQLATVPPGDRGIQSRNVDAQNRGERADRCQGARYWQLSVFIGAQAEIPCWRGTWPVANP